MLLTVALGVAGLVALVQVGVRWARFKVYSFLPPALLLVAFPLGASFGSILLRERFFWNQAEYEYVANQIVAGTYPEKLLAEHQHLGFWVHPAMIDEKPEGACFLVVTHGFAGHSGYCYAADPAKLRDVVAASDWRLSRRLNDQWALVRD